MARERARRVLGRAGAVAVVAAVTGAAPAAGAPYIVTFSRSAESPPAETQARERAQGFRADHVYRRAVEGFSAELSARQVARLREDPEVASVTPDRPVEAAAELAPGEPVPPPGVRRVGAGTPTTVRGASHADVAVLDTGIDLGHPDLNAAAGVNCVDETEPPQDEYGHGTHVAGTLAAENDGAGVTGVAPGTRVHAVKVLSDGGGGSVAGVICGIDWVTSTRTDADPSNDIEVANLSLSGPAPRLGSCEATTDPEHRAICASVAAGVTYVVAAGNRGGAFDGAESPRVPAAYPEVLTATAMADNDGAPGALGPDSTCGSPERDDRHASFSNYAVTAVGREHAIAAPGVCVRSTLTGGGHGPMSGTSMAAPHVAGAVALCLDEEGAPGPCAGLSPAATIAWVRNAALNHAASHAGHGFAGDPSAPVAQRAFGHLAWAGAPDPDTVAPSVATVSPVEGSAGVDRGTAVSISFSEPMDEASAEAAFSLIRVSDGARVPGSASWRGSTLLVRPRAPLSLRDAYVVRVSAAAEDLAGHRLAAPFSSRFRTLRTGGARPSAVAVARGTLASGTAGRLGADDDASLDVESAGAARRTVAWEGRFAGVPQDLRSLRVTHRVRASRACAGGLSVFDWGAGEWRRLDSRRVGAAERVIETAVEGAPAHHVSGVGPRGELRLRVTCTRTARPFRLSSDLLRIAYTHP